ncbi:MAG TPA: TolC family protein [Gemmataceae bacterium]|jgi:cobalt-zinc-cadmium efflux system outer membrane protein|nr:TolC family protein [Gemmataceae bacterium]
MRTWAALIAFAIPTGMALADEPAAKVGKPSPPLPVGVDTFVQFAVQKNPRLVRATLAIDAAKGRQVQAGLYPNPVLAVLADELGDRTAKDGIFSAQVSQEIVLGRKLRLSQAVVAHEIDQATLALLAERYALIGTVRANFYEVLALQRRAAILADVVKLAEAAAAQGQKNFDAKQVSRLDVIQLEVELERFRAEADAVERELPAAYRRLAAVVGDPRLAIVPLAGSLEAELPEYDQDKTREVVLATHPEVRAAKVGIEKAQATYRRAEAEPIPNVTIVGGYVRQYETRSHDGRVGVSIPLPTFNRNQGNVSAALAEVGMAMQDVARAENVLAEQVATAFRTYSGSKQRAERYRTAIVPRAAETYRLSIEGFKGGQFEYLRVLQAQRAVAEARLEFNKSLGEAWRAAGEISGYLLEESWPAIIPPKTERRAEPR